MSESSPSKVGRVERQHPGECTVLYLVRILTTTNLDSLCLSAIPAAHLTLGLS